MPNGLPFSESVQNTRSYVSKHFDQATERTLIFPKMQHLRTIDSGPPGPTGRGFADQKNPTLCPDPEQSHQHRHPNTSHSRISEPIAERLWNLFITPVKMQQKQDNSQNLKSHFGCWWHLSNMSRKREQHLAWLCIRGLECLQSPTAPGLLHPPQNLPPFSSSAPPPRWKPPAHLGFRDPSFFHESLSCFLI